jgi:predicted RNA binding protein YcfA (HicA-like mRNA interferase family)
VSRLPRVGGRDLVQALLRAGFRESHVRGSHHYLRRPDVTGLVVVPVHGNDIIPLGTLRSIIRQTGLTSEEFYALLRD